MRILALATLAAVLGLSSAAVAATPTSGNVDGTKQQQKWFGEAYGQPMNNSSATRRGAYCLAPFCDAFTLAVQGPGELSVKMNAPDSAGYVHVEVTMPDGSVQNFAGESGQTVNNIVFEDVEQGTYVFRIWPNMLYGLDDGQYSGTAKLTPPPPPPAPAQGQ